MTGFVLIGRHIKKSIAMFGVITLTQNFNMEFIQTNKKLELLVFEGYGYIRHQKFTDGASSWRCRITKCNGRVRLRDEKRSYHSSWPFTWSSRHWKENSAQRGKTEQQWQTRLPAKQYLQPKNTSTEKQQTISQNTPRTKGQITERTNKINHEWVSPRRWKDSRFPR